MGDLEKAIRAQTMTVPAGYHSASAFARLQEPIYRASLLSGPLQDIRSALGLGVNLENMFPGMEDKRKLLKEETPAVGFLIRGSTSKECQRWST